MKNIHALTLVVAALSACGSPPKPAMPDGANRRPVNSQHDIDNYRNRAVPRADTSDIGRATQPVARWRQSRMEPAQPPASAFDTDPPSAAPVNLSAPSMPVVATVDVAQIAVRRQSLVFRIAQPRGEARFQPSPAIQTLSLRASEPGRRIDLRGRTDGARADPVKQWLAEQRALRARRILLQGGIESAKI
jgi:hypothetical protein